MSNQLPEAGVQLILDLSQWNRSIARLRGSASDIEAALDEIEQSAERAKRALGDIGDSASVRVNVDDAEIDSAVRKANDLEGSRTLDVDVDVDDSATSGIFDIAAGNIVADLAIGTITGIPSFIESTLQITGINYLVDIDAAEGLIAGTTRGVEGAADIVTNLYREAWGESAGDIAVVVAELARLGVANEDIEDSARAAFEVASITGEDYSTVIRAQTSLVRNGLSPSYRDAADVITAGFRDGLNVGDDFLDTLIEYGSTFDDLGLTAPQVLNTLSSGLDAGIDNTDRIADSMRELGTRIDEVDNADIQSALSAVAQEDDTEAFQQGEITGGEYISGILAGIASIEDESVQETITNTLFGTIAEDFGVDAILALEPVSGAIRDIGGESEEAAGLVNNNLGTAFTTLQRLFETEAASFFDETFNVTERIDALKEQIQTVFDELNAGEGLFASIEIAFGLEGFEESVQRFRRGVSDLALGLLEFIRDVQAFLGRDTSGTEGTIAELGRGAFRQELNEADTAQDVQDAIERALDRYIEPDEIATILGEKIQTAIVEGTGQADVLATGAENLVVSSTGRVSQVEEPLTQQQMGRLQLEPLLDLDVDAIRENAAALTDTAPDFTELETQVNAAAESVVFLADTSGDLQLLGVNFTELAGEFEPFAQDADENMTTATGAVTGFAQTSTTELAAFRSELQGAQSDLGGLVTTLSATNLSGFNLSLPGGTTNNNNITVNNNSAAQAAQSNNLVSGVAGFEQ